jgi:hypothetical protein
VSYNGGNAMANGTLAGTYDGQHMHIIGMYLTAAF